MPALFVCAIVFLVVALLATLSSPFVARATRGMALTTGVVAAVLGVLLIVGSSANSVPVRNVGIVTSFNKPTGEVTGSGLKWVAPWEKVGEWDASRQKYDHIGGDKAVPVRTGTLANAGVELLVEWQVRSENAPRQFLDYKGDFEAFRGQRVGVQLDGAVNDAFASYNPLANIDAKTGNLNVDLKPFADRVQTSAQQRLGADIEILSVTIIRVNHDEKTEANIKVFQDKLAQGRNLDQDLVNAEKQKAITAKNAQVDKTTRCLEIAEKNGTNPGLCINSGIVVGAK
jgi:regulator of protease activity HflC (stomatin/prohibitin superfamily)